MNCKLCESTDVEVIYNDYIRDGAVGRLTHKKYKMYQCNCCNTIWHDIECISEYYQSEKYRQELENNTNIAEYYKLHDKEVLEKLQYTGTEIFRDSIVADIGCGGGSFLDFISGTASKILAIEPSAVYRKEMEKKGYRTYCYAEDAKSEFASKVDVVTSFDVIEHVNDPYEFMRDIYELLGKGGKGIIGTPSDAPIMRKMLGKDYEQFLFSYQHPWILSEKSFENICKKAGFSQVKVVQKQRYGLANTMGWFLNRKPMSHISYEFITDTINDTYKREIEEKGMADYLVAYVEK
jgi:2-polyprenyl-3-methyl-5-hydroxy-6-metoxy-1,4-benzoquinol methylase